MIGTLIVKGLTYSEEKIVNTILKTKNITKPFLSDRGGSKTTATSKMEHFC